MPADQDVIARRVAARLDGVVAGDVTAEVERCLAVGESQQPDTYDPATVVALAALIVNVAGLAWTVYRDLQRDVHKPALQVLSRKIRVEVASRARYNHADLEQIIAIAVEEITAYDGRRSLS